MQSASEQRAAFALMAAACETDRFGWLLAAQLFYFERDWSTRNYFLFLFIGDQAAALRLRRLQNRLAHALLLTVGQAADHS